MDALDNLEGRERMLCLPKYIHTHYYEFVTLILL